MYGERIKQARLMAGWSQDDLVAQLAQLDLNLTKAALSKYETGKSRPKSQVILKLAQALGVRSDYFLREPQLSVQWLAFRRRSKLPASEQQRIACYAEHVVEQQTALELLFNPEPVIAFPEPQPAASLEDAERIAGELRAHWQLGDYAVENMVPFMEDRGAVVVRWQDDSVQFDGLAGWGNGVTPVIVINMSVKEDRRRFDIAHELGHLLMDPGDLPGKIQERLAHRFAAALLVPAEAAYRELGTRRHRLDWGELGLLKQKYGMSMAAWIYRAKDLGIISENYCVSLWRELQFKGWRTAEPFDYVGNEEPVRLKQMTLRALSENLISESQAREICPDCFEHVSEESQVRLTARALMNLPKEDRERLVREALESARNDEVEVFEAYGDDDLDLD
jgi:Zn-dependent peptidase ImmA (M78 family)/DNA-binding XRE family transcriptional regulator